jgi:hypothetical protein
MGAVEFWGPFDSIVGVRQICGTTTSPPDIEVLPEAGSICQGGWD